MPSRESRTPGTRAHWQGSATLYHRKQVLGSAAQANCRVRPLKTHTLNLRPNASMLFGSFAKRVKSKPRVFVIPSFAFLAAGPPANRRLKRVIEAWDYRRIFREHRPL